MFLARSDRLRVVVCEEQGSREVSTLLRTKALGGAGAEKYELSRDFPTLGIRQLTIRRMLRNARLFLRALVRIDQIT